MLTPVHLYHDKSLGGAKVSVTYESPAFWAGLQRERESELVRALREVGFGVRQESMIVSVRVLHTMTLHLTHSLPLNCPRCHRGSQRPFEKTNFHCFVPDDH